MEKRGAGAAVGRLRLHFLQGGFPDIDFSAIRAIGSFRTVRDFLPHGAGTRSRKVAMLGKTALGDPFLGRYLQLAVLADIFCERRWWRKPFLVAVMSLLILLFS